MGTGLYIPKPWHRDFGVTSSACLQASGTGLYGLGLRFSVRFACMMSRVKAKRVWGSGWLSLCRPELSSGMRFHVPKRQSAAIHANKNAQS